MKGGTEASDKQQGVLQDGGRKYKQPCVVPYT